MVAKVLFIESTRASTPSFAPDLKHRGYQIIPAHSGKAALQLAAETSPDVIVLDAASLRTPGNRIALQLKRAFADIPVIHIKNASENGHSAGADVVLYLPFTVRKLVNRIERFLNADKGSIIECGSFKLNLSHRILVAHDKEHRLTPKLAHLMETFMRNPGRTLDRQYLMQKVWQTEYMGDTRTLDVHIRWIREAVEGQPGSPNHIITVRSVGYRFEPEPNGDNA